MISPVEWTDILPEELEATPRLRWTNCPHYEKCLNIVDDWNYKGWTCLYCPYQDDFRKETK